MPGPIDARLLGRLQWLGAAALLAGSIAVFAWGLGRASTIVFVVQDPAAPWIKPSIPLGTAVYRADRENPPAIRFTHEFLVRSARPDSRIRIRAFHDFELAIDGEPVALPPRDPRHWKTPVEIPVADRLPPGEHRIEVVVRATAGPALLQVVSDGIEPPLASGPHWRTGTDEGSRRARVADDREEYPGTVLLPRPLDQLARLWMFWLPCFVLAAVLCVARPARLTDLWQRHAIRICWVAVGLAWGALFLFKGLTLPRALGFDGDGHIEYVDFLATRLRPPLVTDGWMMHHPPLFYAGAALLRGILGAESGSTAELFALRLLPLLSGLGTALAAQLIASRLLPGRRGVAALSVLAAGLLPVNLYMSTFVSNESPNAMLLGMVVALTVAALAGPSPRPRQLVAIGVVTGLALLTKSSSLIVAPIVLLFLGIRLWGVDGRPIVPTSAALAGVGAGMLAIGGWFYLRNALVFGDPVAFNFDLPGRWAYWQTPGFHTPAWYAHFGRSFTTPFFSGLASCWDGIYTSLWGDAYGAGRAGIELPSPFWSYSWMAAIYPLSLPASVAIVVGFARLSRGLGARNPILLRLAHSFVFLVLFALIVSFLWMTLRYPYYGLAKASYLLPAAAPAAVAWSAGLESLDARLRAPRWRPLRALLWGSMGALAFAILAAFLG